MLYKAPLLLQYASHTYLANGLTKLGLFNIEINCSSFGLKVCDKWKIKNSIHILKMSKKNFFFKLQKRSFLKMSIHATPPHQIALILLSHLHPSISAWH